MSNTQRGQNETTSALRASAARTPNLPGQCGIAATVMSASAAMKTSRGSGVWTAVTPISGVNQLDLTYGSQYNEIAVNASKLAIAAWDHLSYSNGGASNPASGGALRLPSRPGDLLPKGGIGSTPS
jgi:hypothetical protein